MPVIIRFTLFLLLGLSLSGPALADTLPLSSVLETMPGKSFADVKAQAQTESGTGPTWGNSPDPSALPFHQTFTGTVTADATMTKLAIFSDDGCDVTVDGNKVWSAKDQGQALPDLPSSLHELPVTLTPGDHTVQIDYSNTVYTVADPSKGIPPDIDGCTLFQYGPAPTVPTVTVQPGQFSPNPAGVGTQMTASLSATVKNPPQSTSDNTITGPTWGWKTYRVETSQDGTTFATATPDSYTISISQPDPTKPDATFAVTFSQPAFYRIQVTATATYHSAPANGSPATDITPSGTDYILGVGPAPASSSSQAVSPSVSTAHAAIAPHAAGAAPSGTPTLPQGQLALVPSLDIFRNGQKVTNSTIPVTVGEGVTLTSQTKPNLDSLLAILGVSLGDWTPSGGVAIGGYTTTDTTGGPIALQTSGKTFKLYWVTGSNGAQVSLAGPFTVLPSVKVNFTVTVPTGSVSAYLRNTVVDDLDQAGQHTGSYSLHLGDGPLAGSQYAGIQWTFNNIDSSAGKYAWVQLVEKASGSRTDKSGKVTHQHWQQGHKGPFPATDNGWQYNDQQKNPITQDGNRCSVK